MDKLIRMISENGDVKFTAVTLRDTVERARMVHHTSPVATAALGRAMAGASMMGSALKQEAASVTLRLNGGGPLGSVIVVSDPWGNVRGYVQNPGVELPRRPDGKLPVGDAIGRDGLLTVIKDFGRGEPYGGSVHLISGEVAEDLAAYYVESEQVGAAVALGGLVDRDRSVLAAGGYLIELLPGAPEKTRAILEQNVADTGPVTDILKDRGPEVLAEYVLKGFAPQLLEERVIEYRCYCSRERVIGAILSTGEKTLEEMAAAKEDTEVSCRFCDKIHRFTPAELAEIRLSLSEE